MLLSAPLQAVRRSGLEAMDTNTFVQVGSSKLDEERGKKGS